MPPKSPAETTCVAVIEAVADEKGVDPRNIIDPLFESIDPDALNTICQNNPVEVSFEYHGYRVTVDSEHNVDLDEVYRS